METKRLFSFKVLYCCWDLTAASLLNSRIAKDMSYPLPLPLLVQKDYHQLRMHLVAIFTEGQVPPLKSDIDEIPGMTKLKEDYKYEKKTI